MRERGTSVLVAAAVAAALVAAATGTSGARQARRFQATAVNKHNLPLGTNKYTTSGPKSGYVYVCHANFNGGGAMTIGPWVDQNAGTWDSTEKVRVDGDNHFDDQFSDAHKGSKESLSGNGLPPRAGTFPVASSDDAYQYDRNPNSIKSYTLLAKLPYNPQKASSPSCVGGTIGVAVNGIPIYDAFDAGGRDAAAVEVQDECDGHPQMSGQYHYHSLSSCLNWGSKKTRAKQVGWALDGFGIYVERDADGTMLSSADLDACHGRTSKVPWHGKQQRIYHYVATLDFPYTVACYKGTPITSATGLELG
jgi:YHYH protein